MEGGMKARLGVAGGVETSNLAAVIGQSFREGIRHLLST